MLILVFTADIYELKGRALQKCPLTAYRTVYKSEINENKGLVIIVDAQARKQYSKLGTEWKNTKRLSK